MIELKEYTRRLWTEYYITLDERTKNEAIEVERLIKLYDFEHYMYLFRICQH